MIVYFVEIEVELFSKCNINLQGPGNKLFKYLDCVLQEIRGVIMLVLCKLYSFLRLQYIKPLATVYLCGIFIHILCSFTSYSSLQLRLKNL